MNQETSTVFPAFADPGEQTLNVLFKENNIYLNTNFCIIIKLLLF